MSVYGNEWTASMTICKWYVTHLLSFGCKCQICILSWFFWRCWEAVWGLQCDDWTTVSSTYIAVTTLSYVGRSAVKRRYCIGPKEAALFEKEWLFHQKVILDGWSVDIGCVHSKSKRWSRPHLPNHMASVEDYGNITQQCYPQKLDDNTDNGQQKKCIRDQKAWKIFKKAMIW